MPIVSADDIEITAECPDCGPTRIILSHGHTHDSVASCATCSREFGRWEDVRHYAKREAVQIGQRITIARAEGAGIKDQAI